VRRPTPKDESEDRQIRREPNAQYRQYGLHECSFCSSPPLRDSFSRDKFLLNHNGVKVPRWNPIGRGTVGRAACSLHQSKGLASGWAVSSLTWARREPSVPGLFRCRGTVQGYSDNMLPAAKGLRGTSRGRRGVVDDSHRRRAPLHARPLANCS
jgi:hypothetical protein